uniref:Uncharacterized protein n=2 Tax=Gloeothece TaxID=28070 RepID=E0U6U9_GLOV7|nr:conserved hypothetical protein [Gloeothece verrucosa PCC 7822]
MLIVVISCNLALTVLNIYIAVRLWRLRRTLIRVTRTLTYVERRINRIFYSAPEFVLKGQQGTYVLRLYYQQLGFQLEQLQKLVSLINLGFTIWRRQTRGKLIKN